MQSLPDLSQLSHAQKDELIRFLWKQVRLLEDRLALHDRSGCAVHQQPGRAGPADVQGQTSTVQHLRVHWRMLQWGARQANLLECLGQLLRIGGAALAQGQHGRQAA
jgi:hypothetical protein